MRPNPPPPQVGGSFTVLGSSSLTTSTDNEGSSIVIMNGGVHGGGGGASGMLQLLQRAAAHVRRPPLVHAGAATISYPQKNKQGRIAVQQWTGTDWRYLRQVPPPGTPDDTEGTTWNGMALAGASGGLLYLMHNSNLDSSRVTVLQYNGYDWSARECVGGGGRGAGARRASSHWAGSWLCRGAPSTRTRLPRSWRRAHHLCGSHSPDHGH